MDQQHWKKINRIVDTALELNENERKDYIQKQCKGNAQLKSAITELLASIEKSDTEDFLEGPESYPSNLISDLSEISDTGDQPSLIGQTIGSYKIMELVDHGGMGSVFLAERADEAYSGKVALKVMRRGMDTPANIARFERERNILAKMDHPNIARLLDGGMTKEGLPYLVMEYVEGVPLYTYCDNNKLSVNERLDLFKFICKAVQHAHNNAIIHRDLKPSNILVTNNGQVKILDFGIAKLLESKNSDTKLFETRADARILTLGYATPEQVQNQNITTATDTYTLGTVLYELLAGVHPFEMKDKDFSEIEEYIKDRFPAKPSVRFSELSQPQQEQISNQRNTNSSALSSILSGDIDAIISKALRKEADRRYSSAEQLLKDLDRRNNNLPIIARKDTFRYKSSKFIKRHKAGLSVAAGFILLIIGFTAFYTWQIAEERNRAREEAQKAEAVTTFLTELLGKSNPYLEEENVGPDISLGSVLQSSRQKINNDLSNQPAVKANIQTVIGEVYSQLGEFGKAESLLTNALQTQQQLNSKPTTDQAETMKILGFMFQDQGNYDKAETLLRRTISTYHNTHNLNTEQAASTIARLGNLSWFNKGKFEVADSLLTEALNIEQNLHSQNHTHIATRHSDLATMNHARGLLNKADPNYQQAIKEYRKLTGEHSNLAIILSNYSALLLYSGEYKQAQKNQLEALNIHRKLTGEQSIDVALGTGRLGQIAMEMNEYLKADSLISRSLEKLHAIYGKSHPYIARMNFNAGKLTHLKGDYQKAEQILKEVKAQYTEVYPENHPRKSDPLLELGLLYMKKENLKKAGTYLEKMLDICQSSYPEESWHIAEAEAVYGEYLLKKEKYEEAEQRLLDSYNLLVKYRSKKDQFTQRTQNNIIQLYRKWEKPELAEQYVSTSHK